MGNIPACLINGMNQGQSHVSLFQYCSSYPQSEHLTQTGYHMPIHAEWCCFLSGNCIMRCCCLLHKLYTTVVCSMKSGELASFLRQTFQERYKELLSSSLMVPDGPQLQETLVKLNDEEKRCEYTCMCEFVVTHAHCAAPSPPGSTTPPAHNVFEAGTAVGSTHAAAPSIPSIGNRMLQCIRQPVRAAVTCTSCLVAYLHSFACCSIKADRHELLFVPTSV